MVLTMRCDSTERRRLFVTNSLIIQPQRGESEEGRRSTPLGIARHAGIHEAKRIKKNPQRRLGKK